MAGERLGGGGASAAPPVRGSNPWGEVRAVLFDCDGTLVDSEGLSVKAMAMEASVHGLSPAQAEELSRFRGGVLADCVAEIERLLGQSLPDAFTLDVRRRMAELFRAELQAMPDALQVVGALRLPYCVASNGPLEKMELSLALTGLLPFFEGRLFSSYTIQRWKPEPDLFLYAARALGVAPRACAVVEDSEPGVRAGVAAGMRVFALSGAGAGAESAGVVPIASLSELRDHLPSSAWAE